VREKTRKRELMDLEGLLWIQKVKIQNTNGQGKGCDNLKKLNRAYVEESHRKVREQEEEGMMC